ncbi:hypothetical protein BJ322DRAFT_349695 [Thelephora terrestris]|uniref:BTB domain-containing protein n=1 Tax=Thelephora terrestris TaxID=56493 RepID=A0A9P6L2J2_9AGAM|nr:hypothetical protein BJ322DRAFT_349695 [Thelephora terrestris]
MVDASRSMTDDTDNDSEPETDSDLEDEEDVGGFQATEASPEPLHSSAEVESSPDLLLCTGAWKTWRALFSYLYTGKIVFSPLRSEKVAPTLPLSCSPKSMYSLAKLVSLEVVVVLSYKQIKRRISACNVVAELFSSFTASDEKILKMESDLLFQDFENDRTSQEAQEHIRAMSCGKAVFQAKTLGFAYHMLLAKKRRAIQDVPRCEPQEGSEPGSDVYDGSGFKLHCARKLRQHAYTVSELLQGLYCPACDEYGKNGKGEYGLPFTRCALCNALRDTASQPCRSCGALFKP